MINHDRMLMLDANLYYTDIVTDYDERYTIKYKFITTKSGRELAYKIHYNQDGILRFTITYEQELPYSIIKYDNQGNVIGEGFCQEGYE